MTYAFEPSERPTVAVTGDVDGAPLRVPVRRVFCVGRNYAAHAREMGADPEREPPFFFSKPADAVFDAPVGEEASLPYPPATRDLHHEVELVVALHRGGRSIPVEAALEHVFGYAVGLDMTRRDLQAAAKKKGRPWALAKGFDHSAPTGALRRATDIGHPAAGRIWLEVDGALRQEGDLAEMIWSVPEVIAALSASVALAPGDLIFTGTPAGVGPVLAGQTLRAGVEGVGMVEVVVTPG